MPEVSIAEWATIARLTRELDLDVDPLAPRTSPCPSIEPKTSLSIKHRKRHTAIGDDEAACLRGDRPSVFIRFKLDEELWDRHGDSEAMFWEHCMRRPGANRRNGAMGRLPHP